jgi:hypothetical protein
MRNGGHVSQEKGERLKIGRASVYRLLGGKSEAAARRLESHLRAVVAPTLQANSVGRRFSLGTVVLNLSTERRTARRCLYRPELTNQASRLRRS